MAEGILPRGKILSTMILAGMCIAFLATLAHASTERRVALVIGNSNYEHTAALRNPENDAAAMSVKLKELGFDVVEGIDLDQDGMQRTIGEFSQKLSRADVGLFFYAGHGLQVGGENYLLPVDGKLSSELDLQFKAVKLNLILRVMEGQNRTSIVLLDACRDNPLAEELSRSISSTRSSTIGSGLARVETGVGTYIGFSTQPGNVALDGVGENSPFAKALITRIDTPGLDIESLMRIVRQDVRDATRGSQIPWGNSSLVGQGFVFKAAVKAQKQALLNTAKPSSSSNAGSTGGSNSQVEITFWNAIKDSTDPSFLEAYIDRYPNGLFVAIARLKLEAFKAGKPLGGSSRTTGNNNSNSADIAYWESVKDKTNVAYFNSYVARYPNGIFVDIAKLKIEELGGKVATTAKPKVEAKTNQQTQELADRQAKQNRELTEIAYWNSILNQNDATYFKSYLVRYPDGMFSNIAKFRIAEFEKKNAKPAASPSVTSKQAEQAVEETQVAKLETPLEPEVEDTPKPVISRRDLARGLQRELNRVGCDAGKVDGLWGKGSRRALRRYGKELSLDLGSLEPTEELYEQLQNVEARVCPLQCGVRQEERNGRCVAKTCGAGEKLSSRGKCFTPKVAEPKKNNARPKAQAKRSEPQSQPAAREPASRPAARATPSGCGTCIIDPADNTVSERVCGRKYVEAKARGWCGRSVRSKRAKKKRTTRPRIIGSSRKRTAKRQPSGCGTCVLDPADNTVSERVCGRAYIDAKARGWCR